MLSCEYYEIFIYNFLQKNLCKIAAAFLWCIAFLILHEEMLFCLLRSSHQKCSLKEGVLENFAISTGKHLCWSLFLIKLHAWRPATFIKRESNMVFPVDIVEILRTPILKKICEWLLLFWIYWFVTIAICFWHIIS